MKNNKRKRIAAGLALGFIIANIGVIGVQMASGGEAAAMRYPYTRAGSCSNCTGM